MESRSVRAEVTEIPRVTADGSRSVRRTVGPLSRAVAVTPWTSVIRPIMAGAPVGSFEVPPPKVWPGVTSRRLLSWPILVRRSAWDADAIPSTPTTAATPMPMPSSERRARRRRVRMPRLATARRSPISMTILRLVADDGSVPDLDSSRQACGQLVVVGDHGDGGTLLVQLSKDGQNLRPLGAGGV